MGRWIESLNLEGRTESLILKELPRSQDLGNWILGTGSWVLDAEPPIWTNPLICGHRCLAISLGRWIRMDQERYPSWSGIQPEAASNMETPPLRKSSGNTAVAGLSPSGEYVMRTSKLQTIIGTVRKS